MPHLTPPRIGFVTTLVRVTNRKWIWRSSDGRYLYSWDPLHGEFEVFVRRGSKAHHFGVVDINGKYIKGAIRGRWIES